MQAIQDLIPDNHCYGCGPDNDAGLQINSYWDGEETVCRYLPKPEQCAGPTRFVYGGTIASLIDCHSICTAMANYYRREQRDVGTAPTIWCVTGKLDINFRAPTPIDQEIELRAEIAKVSDKKTIVHCRVSSAGVLTADAEVIAVRVPPSWMDG